MMQCPYCQQQTAEGKFCTQCGKKLPQPQKRRKWLFLIGGLLVLVVLGSLAVVMQLKPKPVEPTVAISATEEKTVDPEEEAKKAKEALLAMSAIPVDNQDKRDFIVGYWQAGSYKARIEKIGDATYRWKNLTGEGVYKIQLNDEGHYILTDEKDNTYVFDIQDFDSLVFASVLNKKGTTPDNYEIPYKSAWRRTDAQGNAIVRVKAKTEAFEQFGKTFSALEETYEVDHTDYDDGPYVAMRIENGDIIKLGFLPTGNSQWGYKMDEDGKPELPAGKDTLFYIEAPLAFFFDSKKKALSLEEIAALLPSDDTPQVNRDADGDDVMLTYHWQGKPVEAYIDDATDKLSLDKEIAIKMNN